MNRIHIIAFALLLAAAFARAEDAKQVFDTLFAARIKQVSTTADKADDVALAKEMLGVAKSSANTPDLSAMLFDAAYDIGLKHADGFGVAVESMEVMMQVLPVKKTAAREKLLAALSKQMSIGKATEREGAAEAFVSLLIQIGDEHVEAKEYDAAVADYRKALGAATTRKSVQLEDVKQRLDAATQRDRVQKQLDRLQERLLKDAGDSAAADELIRMHVVELDNPQGAQPFITRAKDEELKRLVPLAASSEALTEEQLTQLADWYRRLGTPAGAAQGAMLRRSESYLVRFLESHTAADLARTKATVMLTDVRAALAKAPAATKPAAAAKAPQTIVIEAGVDGHSDLLLTAKEMHWVHHSWDRPSNITVNGKPWTVAWEGNFSKPLPMTLDFANVKLERLGVAGDNRGDIGVKKQGDGFTVSFNDHPNGAGGYKVKLILQTEEDLADELVGAWTRNPGDHINVVTVSRRGKAWTVTGSLRKGTEEVGSYKLTDFRYSAGVLNGRQVWIKNPASFPEAENVEIKRDGTSLSVTWKKGNDGGTNLHEREEKK